MAKKRLDFMNALKAHWSIKVVFAIWALFGIGSTVLTYAPQSWQSKAYMGQYLPEISLSTWMIGALVLLVVFLFEAAFKAYASAHESQPSTTTQSSPAPVQLGISPASGGNATARIGDIIINTAPPPTPPAPRAVPLPRKEKIVHIEPPVPLLDWVRMDNEEIWKKSGPRGGGVQALLLPFYFDPHKSDSGLYMEYTKVHLEFTPDDLSLGKFRVDHGCWLNETYNTTTISLGETKHLVLVLESPDDSDPPWAVSTNRTGYDWYKKHDVSMELIKLPRVPYSIKSVLIWGGNSEFKRVYTFKLDLTKRLS
jgi:hypothetical protein